MPFGLKQEIITDINTVFSHYPGVEKVLLYGSRAKGTYRDGSDIDLSIFSEKMNLKELHVIEDELDDLLLPYKVDLSIFSYINNQNLTKHIVRVGEIFYSKP